VRSKGMSHGVYWKYRRIKEKQIDDHKLGLHAKEPNVITCPLCREDENEE